MLTSHKVEGRKIRHLRVRRIIKGTAERPRLAVFRSLNHIYAQLIDDAAGRTLVAVDSRSAEFRQRQAYGGNVAAAKIVTNVQRHSWQHCSDPNKCYKRCGDESPESSAQTANSSL